MQKPTIPDDEAERLAELDELQLLYTDPEQAFDRVTRELARIFSVPVSTMSLIYKDTQYYKSEFGLPPELAATRIVPRDLSLCGHVVGNNELMVVDDLAKDYRFNDNPLVVQSGARFYAGAPLRTDTGRAIGSLCILDTKPRHISDVETQLLRMVADGLMAEVKLRSISRQLIERSRIIERDLIQARHVQRFLLPPDRHAGQGYLVCHVYHPFDRIGGDFIDLRVRADGSVMIILADVAGHGASAALTSAMAKTSFLGADTAATAADLLTAVNRDLSALVESGRFMTAIALLFDPAQRSVQIASAGHPYPFLLRDGDAQVVETRNEVPLMVDEKTQYLALTTIALRPDDRLLLFTDGAIEAVSPDGQRLEFAGLRKLILECLPQREREFLASLFAKINSHANSRLQDDVALVLLELAPEELPNRSLAQRGRVL